MLIKTLELTVNAELHNLYNWLTSNNLSLNIKKSNYVIFRPYQKKLNYDPQVNIFDNDINKKVLNAFLTLRLFRAASAPIIVCTIVINFYFMHIIG